MDGLDNQVDAGSRCLGVVFEEVGINGMTFNADLWKLHASDVWDRLKEMYNR